MTIFHRDKDTHLKLMPDGKLIAVMGTNKESIDITNNFPLQKWVCVTISLNNNIMDAYLDGKMVKSVKLNPSYSNDSGESIQFGSDVDIYISNFERVPSPTDPKTAYDKYLAGSSGASLVSTLLGNMNVNH